METNNLLISRLFIEHGCKSVSVSRIWKMAFFYPQESLIAGTFENSIKLLKSLEKLCKIYSIQGVELVNPKIQALPEKQTFLLGCFRLNSKASVKSFQEEFRKDFKDITFFQIENYENFERFCLNFEPRVGEALRKIEKKNSDILKENSTISEESFAEPKQKSPVKTIVNFPMDDLGDDPDPFLSEEEKSSQIDKRFAFNFMVRKAAAECGPNSVSSSRITIQSYFDPDADYISDYEVNNFEDLFDKYKPLSTLLDVPSLLEILTRALENQLIEPSMFISDQTHQLRTIQNIYESLPVRSDSTIFEIPVTPQIDQNWEEYKDSLFDEDLPKSYLNFYDKKKLAHSYALEVQNLRRALLSSVKVLVRTHALRCFESQHSYEGSHAFNDIKHKGSVSYIDHTEHIQNLSSTCYSSIIENINKYLHKYTTLLKNSNLNSKRWLFFLTPLDENQIKEHLLIDQAISKAQKIGLKNFQEKDFEEFENAWESYQELHRGLLLFSRRAENKLVDSYFPN